VQAAYAGYIERIGRRPAPMDEDYARLIGKALVAVAEDEGGIVGVLVLRETPEGLLLENIAVHPARQSAGLGHELMKHAEAQARGRGFDSIYLYTNEKMSENLGWYARMGYVEFDRRTEEGFARVYMKKALA
jgi:N-acetylglutamate synthase-like GNAT family acetyltransferase